MNTSHFLHRMCKYCFETFAETWGLLIELHGRRLRVIGRSFCDDLKRDLIQFYRVNQSDANKYFGVAAPTEAAAPAAPAAAPAAHPVVPWDDSRIYKALRVLDPNDERLFARIPREEVLGNQRAWKEWLELKEQCACNFHKLQWAVRPDDDVLDVILTMTSSTSS